MIQRIQSVYLLLASLSLFAIFAFPIVHNATIDTAVKTIKIDGVYDIVNGQLVRTTSFIVLTVVTVLLGILPLVIIFRYKNLKQQLALCYSLILVVIGYSFWMSQTVKSVMHDAQITSNNWGIGMLVTPLCIVFLLGAINGIKKDEKLLKSADRLR